MASSPAWDEQWGEPFVRKYRVNGRVYRISEEAAQEMERQGISVIAQLTRRENQLETKTLMSAGAVPADLMEDAVLDRDEAKLARLVAAESARLRTDILRVRARLLSKSAKPEPSKPERPIAPVKYKRRIQL